MSEKSDTCYGFVWKIYTKSLKTIKEIMISRYTCKQIAMKRNTERSQWGNKGVKRKGKENILSLYSDGDRSEEGWVDEEKEEGRKIAGRSVGFTVHSFRLHSSYSICVLGNLSLAFSFSYF